ncbi:MAG: hypothetical protein ACYS47_17695 [Planctomycetota bacterium]
MATNQDSTDAGKPRPFNRVDNEPLRRVELAFFGLLILALSGALLWRGVLVLRDRMAVFPFVGVEIPGALGTLTGIFYIVLAASSAVAALAMVIRFRK